MPDQGVLIDNDVALKSCAYRCHGELVAATTLSEYPPAMLAIARFTLRSRLTRPGRIADREGAAAALEQLLLNVRLLDPTQHEIELAAELEERATAQALEFDTGESQLVAVLLTRGGSLLVTGDKRAIAALAGIAVTEAKGRVACLEQLMVLLLAKHPPDMLRQRVCAEPKADTALTACFACSSASATAEDVVAGLLSYSNDLRRQTSDLLIGDASLLAVIS